MSTISKSTRYCCTCRHFGGNAKLNGSVVEYENSPHSCKISARGNGCIGAMTSGCNRWETLN